MKFSELWLREWVNPAVTTAELESQLSLAGLEVDSLEPAAGVFSGVIVGEIISAEPHPNADKLQVCQVSDGQNTHQVVCGAPNARAGLKTAFAQIGAVLPGDFKIKKAKLRQVESHGMLSSEQELGLSESHDGIMELAADAPVGADLRAYLQLDDHLFDVDLTPNRSDCLSIAGLAREVGVLNRISITPPVRNTTEVSLEETPSIEVLAPAACPRYLGRIIRGVNPQASTPLWMQERLRRSGIRSIDPLVDVTNYVMLELGQPLHAFDLAQIDQGIRVRFAEPQEKLTLLDGQEIDLGSSSLVIADHSKALALAGIMGGEGSGCSDSTQAILLEVAYFDPLALAGQARRYGLHTDSSHRFERGVDFALQERAMERATQLILEISGGQAGPVVDQSSQAHLPERAEILLRRSRLDQLLACQLPTAEVTDILQRLGFQVQEVSEGWRALAPSFRFDLSIEVDLIEEIARVYGYDRLPTTAPTAPLLIQSTPESQVSLRRLRQALVARDYQEAITYSFIDTASAQICDPAHPPLALSNPISSDLAVMRTSLIPGLAKTLAHNQKRQQARVRLFETGLRFVPRGEQLEQEPMLAGLIAGPRHAETWCDRQDKVDFFDLKGDLEALLQLGGQAKEWRFEAAQHPALHPGQSAKISRLTPQGWQEAGWIGALHPQVAAHFDLKGSAFVFEIQLTSLMQGQVARFTGLSRFPEMRRDLALVVDQHQQVGELVHAIEQEAETSLKRVHLFDVYQGHNLAEGKKSLALGLTWQHPERTLTDDDINSQLAQLLDMLGHRFGAVLR